MTLPTGRRGATLLAAAAVATVAAAAAVDAVRSGAEPDAPAPGARPVEDAAPAGPPARLQVTASIPVERPAGIVTAAGAVWVASGSARTLVRIDPTSAAAVAQVPLDGRPAFVAAGEGRLFAVDQTMGEALRVDPATNGVEGRLPLGSPAVGLAFAGGDAWVADVAGWAVVRLDPSDGEVLARIPVVAPTRVASGLGSVWALSPGERTVSRIDPATNFVVQAVELLNVPDQLAVGSGAVWVTQPSAQAVARIDPATGGITRIALPGSGEPLFVAAGAGAVWVLSLTRLVRIDPRSNRVDVLAPIELARHPGPEPLVLGGLAAGKDAVWIADTYRSAVLRVEVAAPGR